MGIECFHHVILQPVVYRFHCPLWAVLYTSPWLLSELLSELLTLVLSTTKSTKTLPLEKISSTFSNVFFLTAGYEEDHDDDRGWWSGIGGSLLHVGVSQVCPGGHSNHRVWLYTTAGSDFSIATGSYRHTPPCPCVCQCVFWTLEYWCFFFPSRIFEDCILFLSCYCSGFIYLIFLGYR